MCHPLGSGFWPSEVEHGSIVALAGVALAGPLGFREKHRPPRPALLGRQARSNRIPCQMNVEKPEFRRHMADTRQNESAYTLTHSDLAILPFIDVG